MPLDNKISNIIGTKLPQWLLKQLETRANQNSQDSRDNNNLLFLANKTAWVRVVSSINLVNQNDINYFNRLTGGGISNQDDLAKQYVLFGGTSKYINKNSYQIRSGVGKDGAYATLGNDEVKKYGYRPMPGITSVNIETQGRLGSVRSATINFKCWDKDQLDIIDALYFKLGFTMFLEWGNTYFYKAKDTTKVLSSDLYSIDPFQNDLSKEQIALQISKNVRETEGNYDAMLGIVTNFNFSLNQEGGFDCTLRLMALGVLGDSIKINNQGNLPNILQEEIKLLTNTLIQIQSKSLESQLPEPPKKATIDEVLRELKNQGKLSENRIVIPSAPQKLVTVSSKVVEGNKTTYRTTEKIEETGQFFPNDNLVTLKDGSTYVYLRRIGQVVKYDRDAVNTGFVDINLLDTFKSDLSGDFISNILLTPGNNISDKKYSRGSFFKYEYTSPTNKGNTSRPEDRIVRKFINFEYSPVDFKVAPGTDLLKDKIIPAIKEALKGELEVSIYYSEILKTFLIDFKGKYKVSGFRTVTNDNTDDILTGNLGVPSTVERVPITKEGTFRISTDDATVIKDIITKEDSNLVEREKYLASLNGQNVKETSTKEQQAKEQDALYTQLKQAIDTQSALELTLRTIQVHALNKAITTRGNDLEIGRRVYVLKLNDLSDKSGGKPFLNQIFSNGIYSSFINDLLDDNKIDVSKYDQPNLSRLDRLKIQAKYGFATNLMGGKESISSFTPNNYNNLLTAYVVPYQINQEIYQGINTNHPVYIPLGLLFMILNHNCTMYDSKTASNVQTPIVYIDYSIEHNFCLSNTKQLSTNPWITLIPFEGVFEDYKALFDNSVLDNNLIKPASGSQEKIPLFNPQTQDVLSPQIPAFKFDGSNLNVYRGKPMNILLNIDYLVKLARDYSLKDGTNSIYLKTFLEQILSDLNKYLGNINIFRLAYNDQGNTFHIVDDQVIATQDREEQLTPDNISSLPVYGKFSIAKNLEVKTEISSRLSNMLAISANADIKNKATLSSNGDPYGFINTSYVDRYITNRKGIDTGSKDVDIEMIKNSSAQFNKTIYDFYSTINPSEAAVSHATNYFIERMSKIKNDEYPTRASAMIPVSVNFTTDGIAGMSMGQSFTIPDQLLPYTYNDRVVPGNKGLEQDHINKVGFVVVGLNHSLEGNQWNTNVRANMIFLKNKTEFTGSVSASRQTNDQFGVDTANRVENIYVAVEKSTPIDKEQAIKTAKTFFEQKGFKPVQVSAIIGGLLQESQLNPNALNSSSQAYGIAQWLGDRKAKLQAKPNYSQLQTQLEFIIEEFSSSESTAGNRLRSATTLEEAIAAMASYERYRGASANATYQEVLVAAETGYRIGYTKNIYNRYYSI